MSGFVTRFAPSPTGPLHIGHAYSALLAHETARAHGGRFVLRIDDIDTARARRHWEEQIFDDLAWLGITWDDSVRQSDRLPRYAAALDTLWARGLLYVCTCARRDIAAAARAPQEGDGPRLGPDGLVYPGTCRPADAPSKLTAPRGPRPEGVALRLDMAAALAEAPPIRYLETCPAPTETKVAPRVMLEDTGDIVLSRRDFLGSYHLSVVCDDAADGITHVIRGADLADATRIHVLLQHLLSLPTPEYHHHRLIRDATGRRLAKRDDAKAIARYRAEGATPEDIRAMVGLKATCPASPPATGQPS